jgi:hypothetical protein
MQPKEPLPAAPHARDRNFWWSYLGSTYTKCRSGDFMWIRADLAHHAARVRPGDLVVHEWRRRIVSISRIEAVPEFLTSSNPPLGGGEPGFWWNRVAYYDVESPVPFEELRGELVRVEPPDGPMHAETGSGRPGDLYPFSAAGLVIVLQATGAALPWGGV